MKIPVVRDFMTRDLITLEPEMLIYKAIGILLKHKISGASVVDEEGRLVGILSEKDCLRIFANGAFNQLPTGHVVDYMTTVMKTIGPEEGLFQAAGVFLQNPFRRLPVVEEGHLVGQISRRDVLAASQEIWESQSGMPPWTDARYIPDQVKAALETKAPAKLR